MTNGNRKLYGEHTTPREFKHGARDIPFGQGASSLYVDCDGGDPSNDGESGITALDTIQAAIDIAGTWSNIYVKAGIYEENVILNAQRISLVGERRRSVIIAPSSGVALTVSADYCNVCAMTAQSVTGDNSILVTGMRNLLDFITIRNKNLCASGDYNEIRHVKVDSAIANAVCVSGKYIVVHDCIIDRALTGVAVGAADYCEVYGNEISNCVVGVALAAGAEDASVYHNNLTGNTTHATDAGSDNKWFENFWSGHVTDTDHTGLADTAYSFTTGNDYHPLSSRNGWKRQTLGLAPT